MDEAELLRLVYEFNSLVSGEGGFTNFLKKSFMAPIESASAIQGKLNTKNARIQEFADKVIAQHGTRFWNELLNLHENPDRLKSLESKVSTANTGDTATSAVASTPVPVNRGMPFDNSFDELDAGVTADEQAAKDEAELNKSRRQAVADAMKHLKTKQQLPPRPLQKDYMNLDGTKDEGGYNDATSEWAAEADRIVANNDVIDSQVTRMLTAAQLTPETVVEDPLFQAQLDLLNEEIATSVNTRLFQDAQIEDIKDDNAFNIRQLETDDRNTQRGLDIQEIKADIESGQLALAAQKAKSLNLRETRGQTLDFLSEIAKNPSALASIMQSKSGQDMLTSLGFGALAAGATPAGISRFFEGGQAGRAPGMQPGLQGLSEEEITDLTGKMFTRAQMGKDSRFPGGPEGIPGTDEAIRSTIEADIRANGGGTADTFDPGSIRKPGRFSSPGARGFRDVQDSGNEQALLFEAALAGVSPEQLLGNINATRTPNARPTPQRAFQRRRFS